MVAALTAYNELTRDRTQFLRADELCRRAAEQFPGLVPSREELEGEAALALRDKRGLEARQGDFLAEVLGDPACGLHLCHAMLLPREDSTNLAGEAKQVEKIAPAVEKRKKAPASRAGVLVVGGMDKLLTQLARCCKPVPPDPIRGFVTRGKGVSVHREDCPSLKRLSESQPERLIDADWGKGGGAGEALYTVEMSVTAGDRRGLLRDIGDALAREKINVTAVRTQSRDDLAFMRFTFDVTNVAHLKRAFTVVRQLKGVIRVTRG